MSIFKKRETRSLISLVENAQSNRILNLLQADKTYPDYAAKPFFKNRALNSAIIVKHAVRPEEQQFFRKIKNSTTKVILPFENSELKLGGGTFMVDQIGYEDLMKKLIDADSESFFHDMMVLKSLDEIPSLDPFLVREYLARKGYYPSNAYLRLSKADQNEMVEYVRSEISKLTRMACGENNILSSDRLTEKILSRENDLELIPLMRTFRLNSQEFVNGIFSWRGFLYFQWRLNTLVGRLSSVLKEMSEFKPSGKITDEQAQLIVSYRRTIGRLAGQMLSEASQQIAGYRQAYATMTEHNEPKDFRRFLMDGPQAFYILGERMGILSHFESYWNYRVTTKRSKLSIHADDYIDLLEQFNADFMTLNLETRQ